MNIDRLVSDLKTTAALLFALKRVLRSSGHRITPLEARDLYTLKARATRLCSLRAHLRGKLHLPTSLDEQAAFVDEERQTYTLKKAA